VYLSTPPAGPDAAGTYDGIPPASLGGYFTITNVTTTSFDIAVNPPAVLGSTYAVAGQTAKPPYATAAPGGDTRTKSSGLFTADLSTSPGSQYYTVTANVGVDDGSGNVVTSQISYQVYNNQASAKNTPYGARTATNPATIVAPTNLSPRATAKLVDENGFELPRVNGQYLLSRNGYLKIETTSGSSFLAIDSLDSQELGKPNASPSEPGTKRGFAHYFNLNDFYKSNVTTPTGDTQFGSANNLKVEDRLRSNNSLLSVGNLSLGNSTVSLSAPPNYTYQLNPGDNATVSKLAQLSAKSITFPPNGGLGPTTQTLTGYIGQIIGGIATNASNASTSSGNAQALLTSYQQQSSAISGVNLDTELANTVIYQNAYAASARVITVTSQLFDTLLQSVG
jgi:flagellar hook-associated protein FlgK